MSKYRSTQINDVLNMKPGDWFLADIIGYGVYEMVKNGINNTGNKFAIVKCQKIFGQAFKDRGHETTCHPISPAKWNTFRILKRSTNNG